MSAAFLEQRARHVSIIDDLCISHPVSLDAPEFIPAGGCVSFSPYWFGWGFDSAQAVILRGGK